MYKVSSRRIITRWRIFVCLAISSLLCYTILDRSHNYSSSDPWFSVVDLKNTLLGSSNTHVVPADDIATEVQLYPSVPPTPLPQLEHEPSQAPNDVSSMVQFWEEYEDWERKLEPGSIYGSTVFGLEDEGEPSVAEQKSLRLAEQEVDFTPERPYIFNPYPNYNSIEWNTTYSEHFPCTGPGDTEAADIGVLRGRPVDYPAPSFGSYSLLGLDDKLCFERSTRLGMYGFLRQIDTDGRMIKWDKVPWGALQSQCVEKNKVRFDTIDPTYSTWQLREKGSESLTLARRRAALVPDTQQQNHVTEQRPASTLRRESRTAVLLRSYTGKEYTENDKQIMRSLITELCLRSGGEYSVFLLVQSKNNYDIWANEETYQYVVENEIPEEFRNITILWNDDIVNRMYPALSAYGFDKTQVHNAQYLSVQKFSQEHPEFDFVWNWEMDVRVIGHHYDMLTKLAAFSKKQPRKGLWERNERFYIPSIHGDYDTGFRRTVWSLSGNDSIWGAPRLPYIKPSGPTPPVESPGQDDYEWGVDEDADLITLSPIFNPVNSNWILRNQVWGYGNGSEDLVDLPRRATIVTHSRISKKLLEAMHGENLNGNHLGSEMTPQTVALLHGLKAVYAPMPVFFDRPWTGDRLARWFNGGPKGESGGIGSAMGWGREGRFRGTTWYFRADPPQRLYNNWLGFEDTGIGGESWEAEHGRSCLPAMLLHPIKNYMPMEAGGSSKSKLPYR